MSYDLSRVSSQPGLDVISGQPGYAQAIRNYQPMSFGIDANVMNPNLMPGGVGSDIAGAMPGNGLNFGQKLDLGLKGVGTVANLVLGLKQLSLANKQYGLQKRAFETNLTNQVRSYNDSMSDRLRARAVTETGNTNGVDQQIRERSLTTGM